MSLPTPWALVPVSGTYVDLTGTPCVGSVRFSSGQVLTVDGATVVPAVIEIPLDAEGHFSTHLPATNDPHLSVTTWAYTVIESFDSARPQFAIFVPYDSPGIDMSTVAPVVPPPQLVDTRGPAGADGPPGAAGADGPPGAGVQLSGRVATYGDLPADPVTPGVAYIVNADGLMYVWDGAAFPANGAGASFKGDPGAQGIQGPQGAKGDTGIQGAKGDAGAQGIQGIQGIKGDTGAAGPVGAASTVAGPQGEQGIQGIQGIQGVKGDTGPQGPQGVQGDTGAAGAGGMTNPMTTTGDMIVGGASGAPTRVGISTDGYVWTLTGGTPGWAAAASGGSAYYKDTFSGTPPTAGVQSLVIGNTAIGNDNDIVIGYHTTAGLGSGSNIVIGDSAQARNTNCVVIGDAAGVFGAANSGIAIGAAAQVTSVGAGGIAIGPSSSATVADAIAIGSGSVANVAGTVSIGVAGSPRKLVNVGSGSNATDAATIGQLCIADITATPIRVGQLAVVAGVGYMACGTSSAADWKQVTA